MPGWRRVFHACTAGLMCLLFAGVGIFNGRFVLPGPGRPLGMRVASGAFIAFAIVAITGSIRFSRRMISEFSYDGATLRFRTLGIAGEIAEVREWQGRGGPVGYKLIFRDASKAYLEYSVSNASALAEELRRAVG
jgi:hypothetical protein